MSGYEPSSHNGAMSMSLCQRQKHGWTPGYRKHLYQDQPKGQSEEPDQVGISYSGLRIGGEVERFKLVDLSPDCAIEQILAVSLSLSERDEIASDPEKKIAVTAIRQQSTSKVMARNCPALG
jgi:hypothetical protein